jgi:hypothetical protein
MFSIMVGKLEVDHYSLAAFHIVPKGILEVDSPVVGIPVVDILMVGILVVDTVLVALVVDVVLVGIQLDTLMLYILKVNHSDSVPRPQLAPRSPPLQLSPHDRYFEFLPVLFYSTGCQKRLQ